MKRDDGFVNEVNGSTKFRLEGDKVRIHWKSDGSFYREDNAWFREADWAAEVKKLRAKVARLRREIAVLKANADENESVRERLSQPAVNTLRD